MNNIKVNKNSEAKRRLAKTFLDIHDWRNCVLFNSLSIIGVHTSAFLGIKTLATAFIISMIYWTGILIFNTFKNLVLEK